MQPSAVALARKNALLNKVKIKSSVSEANKFLVEHKDDKFDCVDIDPFGSPAEFVQNAFQALQPKNSVLAVTATDLGALSGVYPEAGFRKYALVARESPFLHELGVRNLIAYCYEQAARQDLIVVPVMSYYNKHYYRVFLKLMGSGKKQAREHVRNIGWYVFCSKCLWRYSVKLFESAPLKCENCSGKLTASGPTWTGFIHDETALSNAAGKNEFIARASLEAGFQEPFFDLHFLAKSLKRECPPNKNVIQELEKQGYVAVQSLFEGHALKTNAPFKQVLAAVKKCT